MASAIQRHSVRIHRSGDGQWIDIPKEFELRGDEATIVQDARGRLIVMESVAKEKRHTLTELLNSWVPLGDEDAMPEIEDLPPEPVEL